MTIRNRLTWLFVGVVAVLLFTVLALVYALQVTTSQREFRQRLRERFPVPDGGDGLVEDLRDTPSPLPLLQVTLTNLWEARQGGLLTHEAFERLG